MKLIFYIPLALSAMSLSGATTSCDPQTPATCNSEPCCTSSCLGPTEFVINAPVAPHTCNGDFVVTAALLYWRAMQTGLEYGVLNQTQETILPPPPLNFKLIQAEYESPNFNFDFGFKLGLGYLSPCDGWDIGAIWTSYHGSGNSKVDTTSEENQTLLTLWNYYSPNNDGAATFSRDIRTRWSLDSHLIDIELGRKFWNSPRVALRPHVGIRISSLNQDYDIDHMGGILAVSDVIIPPDPPLNNEVRLKNDFKSAGIRSGLDGEWNLGCGFSLQGSAALSFNTGKFHYAHTEQNREAISPFSKSRVLEAEDSLRATRLFTDLGLGVQYFTLLSDCKYALAIFLGYEQHLFMHLNQMWRVHPTNGGSGGGGKDTTFNQRRGNLTVQGWTLKAVLDF